MKTTTKRINTRKTITTKTTTANTMATKTTTTKITTTKTTVTKTTATTTKMLHDMAEHFWHGLTDGRTEVLLISHSMSHSFSDKDIKVVRLCLGS